jgi:hypothetical protein
LLLGKNGGVADAVSSAVANDSAVVYVTESGTKTYTNASGSEYTSFYFKGIKPNGSEIEYSTTQDWIKPGDMLKITFDSNGKMSVGSAKAGSNITGTVDADLCLIGSTSIAANATILDTNLGNYEATSLRRLNGVRFQPGDVLYYEASGGKVTTLILNDVTGDTAKYGVVTSASSGESSGTYVYMIDGVSATLSSNASFGAGSGAAKFYGESGKISMIGKLYSLSTKVKTFNGAQITVNDDVGTYPLAADVSVYANASGGYKVSILSEALKAFQAKKMVTFYYDKDPEEGGCVRVITY